MASRLPMPKVTPSSASVSAASMKRGTTRDLEQGTSKRLRTGPSETPRTSRLGAPVPSNLNKAKSKSMMVLKPRVGVSSRVGSSRPGVSGPSAPARSFNASAKLDSFARPEPPPSLRSSTGRGPPKWDLKSRVELMEKRSSENQSRIAFLEKQKEDLEVNVTEKENKASVILQEVDGLKEVLSESKSSLLEKDKALRELGSKAQELEFASEGLKRKISGLTDELDVKMEEVRGLKSSLALLSSSSAGMEAKIKVLEMERDADKVEISRLARLSEEQAEAIKTYEEKAREHETERRKLHNLIQELKGNIRVFCRLRPLLGEEVNTHSGKVGHIDLKEDSKSLALLKSPDSPQDRGLKAKNTSYDFEFDRVFGPEASQVHVFEEISQLVQSAIDGYNVCVFAYGQTGSGKTFTMEGGESLNQEGMIPKTIRKIFKETGGLEEKGWTYKLEATFVEIYNEEIRDLLATEKNLKYEIKMSDSQKKGEIHVSNAKIEYVNSESQINNLLRLARKNRAVAATNCNERSSRSHSVFTLKISGSNGMTGEACQGCLNLVDLAGSERLKDSGSEGARLKETQSINKSLSNLSNVIMALAQKESHVPFRNSKLTHLLQNSLGGNSKTLMFVNISPKEEYFNETLNSLRFATKVNQCQIGTATKKVR
eukprot:TRINITY_DN1975_c0_g1_i1.p1 TRINITY_DN1975_c0_g1~~TRINITY_DN1975_c0_g1_i1.p1  ORF type:complete len:674 (+),score=264.64 TRINITY_DN1975_c0_g1_i1:56-2023(+)